MLIFFFESQIDLRSKVLKVLFKNLTNLLWMTFSNIFDLIDVSYEGD